jgi:hypothetical protein
MRTSKKAARSAARGKVDHAKAGPRPGSKLAKIATMLKRPTGCTAAEVMKACDWPSVSMPQQAKALGVKLKKEKQPGSPTRYRVA